MIRRDAGSDFLLFAQHDHALAAGALSLHVGNSVFAKPDPFDAFVDATRLHDCGWPLHDDSPTLNTHGQPTDVFEIPRTIALKVWRESVDRAQGAGDWQAMLVSLHVVALSAYAARHIVKRHDHFDPADAVARFEMQKFQQHEFERQVNLRQSLGLRCDLPLTNGLAEAGADPREDQLRFNIRMLQLMDAISLAACCTHPPFPLLKDVPNRPGGPAHSIELIRQSDNVLVRPWMFHAPEVCLKIPFRRLLKTSNQDEQSFQDAYAHADVEMFSLRIVSPP